MRVLRIALICIATIVTLAVVVAWLLCTRLIKRETVGSHFNDKWHLVVEKKTLGATTPIIMEVIAMKSGHVWGGKTLICRRIGSVRIPNIGFVTPDIASISFGVDIVLVNLDQPLSESLDLWYQDKEDYDRILYSDSSSLCRMTVTAKDTAPYCKTIAIEDLDARGYSLDRIHILEADSVRATFGGPDWLRTDIYWRDHSMTLSLCIDNISEAGSLAEIMRCPEMREWEETDSQ